MAATTVGTGSAAVVHAVEMGGVRAFTEPAFIGCMTAFVVLTSLVVIALYRRPPARRWVAAPERRWIFGGVLGGVGLLVFLVLCLGAAVVSQLVDERATAALGPGVGTAAVVGVVAWVVGSVMTGLPLWLLLAGLVLGPGARGGRADGRN